MRVVVVVVVFFVWVIVANIRTVSKLIVTTSYYNFIIYTPAGLLLHHSQHTHLLL